YQTNFRILPKYFILNTLFIISVDLCSGNSSLSVNEVLIEEYFIKFFETCLLILKIRDTHRLSFINLFHLIQKLNNYIFQRVYMVNHHDLSIFSLG
ncbi:hypothetical protein I010_10791, partial [Pasteurella multocida 1500C]